MSTQRTWTEKLCAAPSPLCSMCAPAPYYSWPEQKEQKVSWTTTSLTTHFNFKATLRSTWHCYLADQHPIILQSVSRLFQLHQEERDGWRNWMKREILLYPISRCPALRGHFVSLYSFFTSHCGWFMCFCSWLASFFGNFGFLQLFSILMWSFRVSFQLLCISFRLLPSFCVFQSLFCIISLSFLVSL